MSRQSKQKHTIALRQQVTAAHARGVSESGLKRTKQNPLSRPRMGFTQKLTSINKGKMGAKQQKDRE